MANWIQGEILRRIKEGGELSRARLEPGALVALQSLIDRGVLLHGNAKKVLDVLWEEGGAPDRVVEALGLATVGDDDAIRKAAREAVLNNPKQAERYAGGNTRMIGFFMGQVMRALGGRADPATAHRIIVEELESIQ